MHTHSDKNPLEGDFKEGPPLKTQQLVRVDERTKLDSLPGEVGLIKGAFSKVKLLRGKNSAIKLPALALADVIWAKIFSYTSDPSILGLQINRQISFHFTHLLKHNLLYQLLKKLKSQHLTTYQKNLALIEAAKKQDLLYIQALLTLKETKDISNYLFEFQKHLNELKEAKLKPQKLSLDLRECVSHSRPSLILAYLALNAIFTFNKDNIFNIVYSTHNEEKFSLLLSAAKMAEGDLKNILSAVISVQDYTKLKLALQHPDISTEILTFFINSAICKNNPSLVRALINHPLMDLNARAPRDVFGDTLLLQAIRNKNLEIVKILIEHPTIDINIIGLIHMPLSLAVATDQVEMVKLILQHKNIQVYLPYLPGHSIFSYAISRGNNDIIHLFFLHKHRMEFSADVKKLAQLGSLPSPHLSSFCSRLFAAKISLDPQKFINKAFIMLADCDRTKKDILKILEIIQEAPLARASQLVDEHQNNVENSAIVDRPEEFKNLNLSPNITIKLLSPTQNGFLIQQFGLALFDIKKNPADDALRLKATYLYNELSKLSPLLPFIKLWDIHYPFHYNDLTGKNKIGIFPSLSAEYTNSLNFILNKSYQTRLNRETQRALRLIVYRMGSLIEENDSFKLSIIKKLIEYLIAGLDTNKWHAGWFEAGAGPKRVCAALNKITKARTTSESIQVVQQLIREGRTIHRFLNKMSQPEQNPVLEINLSDAPIRLFTL